MSTAQCFNPRIEYKGTSMQSSLNFNITKTIFHTPPIHEVYGNVTPCYVSCLPTIRRINAELTTITPHSHPLTNTFHNRVSAVITVLYTSRPRALRLARRVSSRAFFVASEFPRCLFFLLITLIEPIGRSIIHE